MIPPTQRYGSNPDVKLTTIIVSLLSPLNYACLCYNGCLKKSQLLDFYDYYASRFLCSQILIYHINVYFFKKGMYDSIYNSALVLVLRYMTEYILVLCMDVRTKDEKYVS